jgi:hypothetical protein
MDISVDRHEDTPWPSPYRPLMGTSDVVYPVGDDTRHALHRKIRSCGSPARCVWHHLRKSLLELADQRDVPQQLGTDRGDPVDLGHFDLLTGLVRSRGHL